MSISKIRPIRSYVLRQGRLTKHQAEGVKSLSPLYAIPFGDNTLNWDTIFNGQGKPIRSGLEKLFLSVLTFDRFCRQKIVGKTNVHGSAYILFKPF